MPRCKNFALRRPPQRAKHMHCRTLAIVFSLGIGCFTPSDGSIPIRCDEANPCPSDRACVGGLCAAPLDLAVAADLATVASVGCASSTNAQKLSDRMWACPGAFNMGGARSLCAQGWSVCKDIADVNPMFCEKSVHPFFIADVPAYRPGTNPLICAQTTIYQRMFGGCGDVSSVAFSSTCTAFPTFAVDQFGGYDFRQGAHTIDAAVNTSPASGVLCCR